MKCFISYSHKDRVLKDKFLSHLKPLEESYGLEIFTDRSILPGENWEKKIWDEFESSEYIFLLVSANFINSEFCYKKEFKRAIEKHRKNQVVIVPIILKDCAWASVNELAELQVLPDEGQPISGGSFKRIDNGIKNAILGIKKIILSRLDKKPKSSRNKPPRPMASKYKKTNFRAIFFDLDGTLVRGKIGYENFRYSWQLVWSHLGFDDSIRKFHYQRYVDGKISYNEWCDITRDLFREKNLCESSFQEMAKKVRLTKNCKETLKILKDHGFIMVIVSGGIDSFLKAVFPDHREYFDYVFINKFHYNPEGVIEQIEKTPYDFDGKFDAIEYVRKKYGLKYSDCVFVGEGRNDIYAARKLAKHGGLSIGYPSEHLQDYASYDLWKDRLDAVLDIMFDDPPISGKLHLGQNDL